MLRSLYCSLIARMRAILVLLFIVQFDTAVLADVRNPIKLSMPRDTQVAVSGQAYSGTLRLVVPKDGAVESIEIGGEGWVLIELGIAPPIRMRAGETLDVPFRANVADAVQKLEVRVTFEGERTVRRFDLSAGNITMIGRPRATAAVGGFDNGPVGGARRQPVYGVPAEDGGAAGGCDDREIRVRGNFAYVRPDGQVIGADTIRFRVMDQDDFPSSDEVMFEGVTDVNGNFDVTICWDDCDISGCDDPDVYMYFECDTGVAIVRNDDFGEDTYAWSSEDTQLYGDYEGNDLNFGNMRPADPGTAPAIHIWNSVVRSHRFVLENNSYSTPQVTVVWQDQNGAFYNAANEIHIGPDEQWNEGTQIHEWGHHLLTDWTDPLAPDYCNGFCDDSASSSCGGQTCMGNGGHCVWCAETDHDAWNEGFPDWLGSVVMRNWAPRYGGASPSAITDSRYTLEVVQLCCTGDPAPHNALTTEGFVGALLRDMDDPPVDAGQTGCPQDSMQLGSDEILAVVRAARPIRVTEFITAFRAAYPEYEHDFRGTAQAVSSTFVNGWPMPALQVEAIAGCGSVRIGNTITLHVETNASQYSTCMRWQRDGSDITDGGRVSGATTDTLRITGAVAGDAGRYVLRITSCDGAAPTFCNGTQTITSPPITVRIIGDEPAYRITGWGRNTFGMLGRGTDQPDSDPNPAYVINLTNAVGVSAGYWNSVAVLADGTAWSWGARYLGDGTSNGSSTPVRVNNLTDIVAVSAGGGETSMALDSYGHIWTWGSNYYGQLGYHQQSGVALNPGQVDLDCVVSISIGQTNSAAVTSDGSLWVWGANTYGQLGQGTTGSWVETPVRVPDLSNITEVECGSGHILALRDDGTVWAAGMNSYGQLGDGTFEHRNRYVQVSGLTGVVRASAGLLHSIAVRNDGTAWTWGLNTGLGTGQNGGWITTPARVLNVQNVRNADGGYGFSAFIDGDNVIWTCGDNYAYDLGRPVTADSPAYLPAPVDPRVGAAVVASAGTSHVLTIAPGARITTQPAHQLVAGCGTARFTVATSGEPPMSFVWRRIVDGVSVPLDDSGRMSGTRSATLTISSTDVMDSGEYEVRVFNATNHVTSSRVTLSTPPFVNDFDTAADAGWFGNERGNWAISNGAYAAGAPNWYPATYSSFSLPVTDFIVEFDVVNASIENFNMNGGMWLRSKLTSGEPQGLMLTWGDTYPWGGGDVYWHRNYGSGWQSGQNIAQSVYTPGQTLHLRIEARGDTFAAYANDAQVPTTTITTPDFPAGRMAVLDNANPGTLLDNIWVQTLTSCDPGSGNEPVRILQRPLSQTVEAGAQVTLSVTATGTGPLQYQWVRNGSCVAGANSLSYSFTASAASEGRYECTVANACGSVGSYPAFVSVNGDNPPADVNCDGLVNNFDINPFVLALSDPELYAQMFPDCPITSADINGDGVVNNFDIDPFVACMVNGGCP